MPIMHAMIEVTRPAPTRDRLRGSQTLWCSSIAIGVIRFRSSTSTLSPGMHLRSYQLALPIAGRAE